MRAAALRFGDARVQAVLSVMLLFTLLPMGFRNRELRERVAPLLGLPPERYGPWQATCDLRRLRLRGLIKRVPGTHRYRLTDAGQRVALCYCPEHRRTLNPMLAAAFDAEAPPKLGRVLQAFDEQINRVSEGATLAA